MHIVKCMMRVNQSIACGGEREQERDRLVAGIEVRSRTAQPKQFFVDSRISSPDP